MGRISGWALAFALSVSMLAGGLVAIAPPSPAQAAQRSDFDAGNIISDATFYNPTAMGTEDIQAFLNARVPTCRAGYTCLKSYREDMGGRDARSGCSALPPAPNISAAQIIQRVGVSCGINPQALIVLLEKEQGLVTDTDPSAAKYRIATGYGCPDTAACDTQYYGFANQVYSAARQFRVYRSTSTSWAYQAGRVNTIRWHPNAACGSSQVYIANQATAGLYIYTPYRPNDAALNNLYGTGDACSSYGNRNFWRIFTDWFGSPTIGSPLVRAAGSLQIWLLSAGSRFPINNPDVYAAFAPLGSVVTVSASYLDSVPARPEVSRFVGDPAGNLYLVDGGNRFHFDSCERIADWGYPCANWTTLEQRLVDLLNDRGTITNVVRDASSNLWSVSDGTRAEAVDLTAMQQAGRTENPVSMTDAALYGLTVRDPILRPEIVVKQDGVPNYWLYTGGILTTLSSSLYNDSVLRALPATSLVGGSAVRLRASGNVSGVVFDGDSRYLLAQNQKVRLGPSAIAGVTPTRISRQMAESIPSSGEVGGDPIFLRAVGTPTVYLVTAGARKSIPTWADYERLALTTAVDTIFDVPADLLAGLPDTGETVAAGVLIRGSGSAAAYVTDGTTGLIYVSSYDVTQQLGFGTSPRIVTDATITGRTVTSEPLRTAVGCNGSTYLGVDGTLRSSDADLRTAYGITATTPLAASTCTQLTVSRVSLTQFIRDPSGAVWKVAAGKKRYIPSVSVLRALGGTEGTITDFSARATALIPSLLPLISASSQDVPTFVRAIGDDRVYRIGADGRRSWIVTPEDLPSAVAGVRDATTYLFPRSIVDEIPVGLAYLRSGVPVRATDSPNVFFTDSASTRVYVGSADVMAALGVGRVRVVAPSDLAPIALRAGPMLSSALTCGGRTYVGLLGALHEMPSSVSGSFGTLPLTAVSADACAALPISADPLTRFLRAPDGRVYYLENGIRRHVLSPGALAILNNTNAKVLDASAFSIAQFPEGAPVS